MNKEIRVEELKNKEDMKREVYASLGLDYDNLEVPQHLKIIDQLANEESYQDQALRAIRGY